MINNIHEIAESNLSCCGCGTCALVCPTKAISFKRDKEGFSLPVIDNEKCIGCSLCLKKCPMNKKVGPSRKPNNIFAFKHSDDEVWSRSSSGGMFTAIVQTILKKTSKTLFVYAARMDGTTVKHELKEVQTVEDIDVFRKSKYVQSDFWSRFDDCFTAMKDPNAFIVFVGTPCQISAVDSIFSKHKGRYMTVDFVCHGVGSPGIFDDFCKRFYKKPIAFYSFREKKIINKKCFSYFSNYSFAGDKKIRLRCNDAYTRLFLNQLITRKCCQENCVFRKRLRESDITLGDFRNHCNWLTGSSRLCAMEKNISMVIPNTAEGMGIVRDSAAFGDLEEVSSEAIKENKLYYSDTYTNPNRDRFFENYDRQNVKKYFLRWLPKYNVKKYSYLIAALKPGKRKK